MGKRMKEKQDERGMMGERERGKEVGRENGREGRKDGREGRKEGREKKGAWM